MLLALAMSTFVIMSSSAYITPRAQCIDTESSSKMATWVTCVNGYAKLQKEPITAETSWTNPTNMVFCTYTAADNGTDLNCACCRNVTQKLTCERPVIPLSLYTMVTQCRDAVANSWVHKIVSGACM